jgi:hypothetical protein
MEGIEIMDKLEITLKITDKEGIIIGRSVILFGKPRYVAGLWNNNSVVFSILEPKTMPEIQVLIYTIDELREFAKDGDLKGMVEL